MKRIKLVHVTSSLKIGGAERVLFDLITHLDPNKYEQVVVYIHDGPYREQLEQLGIPTFCVRGFFFRYDPWLLVCLWRLFKKLKPDVVHTLLWSANVAGRCVARFMRIPCVAAVHNNCEQNGFVRNSIDKLTAYKHAVVVAVSQEVAQSAVCHAWVPAQKIQVITNGVQPAVSTQQITREALGLSENHFIIGSVGRFHPVKRYDLLLKVFAQISRIHAHARLLLLGVGELEHNLRAQAQNLGIDHLVTFVIAQPAQNYYSLFDCFVQTSAQEGVSIALLEAMSAALPCVVMNTGHKHSVITHKVTGLVVPATDTKGLDQAIEGLIIDHTQAVCLGSQAQKEVQMRFSLDAMVKAYAGLFDCVKKGNI